MTAALALGRRPLLMGIVNLTPDSFSDGGRLQDVPAVLAHGQALIEAGADMLDIGAESTRPGATPLSSDQEQARLDPLFARLDAWRGVRVSLDTRHAATAAAGIAAGVQIINDVSGGRDPGMAAVLAAHPAVTFILGHALAVPADPTVVLPANADPVAAVAAGWAAAKLSLQVPDQRLWLDPGFGFGKTAAHNRRLLAGIGRLVAQGLPIVAGISRKRFLGGSEPRARDAATAVLGVRLALAGVHVLRVHNIAEQVAALHSWGLPDQP